jgi:hypothetical protein
MILGSDHGFLQSLELIDFYASLSRIAANQSINQVGPPAIFPVLNYIF